MVLQAKALVAGLALMATAALAFTGTDAKASSGGKKAKKSSAGKKTPSGVDPAHLADQTTDALIRQDIAKLRTLGADWKKAGDELTSAALLEDLEQAVKGTKLEEWKGDGNNGSPLFRAFGDRVLLLEGRPEKLLLWADSWRPTSPVLAAALKTKADAIDVDPKKGTTDDPVPDQATLERIIKAVSEGDPTVLRKLADELEKAGFDEQAADLRAMADLIEAGTVKPPEPFKPAPAPAPEPHEPQHDPDEPKPPAPAPEPKPAPKPAGGPGRIVIVKKGEGPFQVTQRLLGKDNGGRFTELVKANIPPKHKAKGGGFTTLAIGEHLKVPSNWPASPDAIIDPGGGVAPAPSPSPSPGPAPSSDRFVTVQHGEGPYQVTQRVLGDGSRFHELVNENIPPKISDHAGGFTSLNAGERLKVPASWPDSAQFSGEGHGAPANARQVDAGKIALAATLGKMSPEMIRAWQAKEGLPVSGVYDTPSAYVLCFRFGIVPPVPNFAGAQGRKKFISQMLAAARKDPQRRDEYVSRARAAQAGG